MLRRFPWCRFLGALDFMSCALFLSFNQQLGLDLWQSLKLPPDGAILMINRIIAARWSNEVF